MSDFAKQIAAAQQVVSNATPRLFNSRFSAGDKEHYKSLGQHDKLAAKSAEVKEASTKVIESVGIARKMVAPIAGTKYAQFLDKQEKFAKTQYKHATGSAWDESAHPRDENGRFTNA